MSFAPNFPRKRRFSSVCAELWSTTVPEHCESTPDPLHIAGGVLDPALGSSGDGEAGSHGDGSDFGERSGPGCSSRMVGPPGGARKESVFRPSRIGDKSVALREGTALDQPTEGFGSPGRSPLASLGHRMVIEESRAALVEEDPGGGPDGEERGAGGEGVQVQRQQTEEQQSGGEVQGAHQVPLDPQVLLRGVP